MLPIASLTFLRLKEPAFLLLVAVGLFISYCISGLGSFSSDIVSRDLLFGQSETQGTILLGSILVTLLGGLITVFNAAAEIPRDISSRMIAILLSKPISRLGYIWGKYLGTLAIGLSCSFLWLSFMLFSRIFLRGELDEVVTTGMLWRQYACLVFLIPLTGVSVGISCYFSDIVAMIITCIYMFVCFVGALAPVVVNFVGETSLAYAVLLPYYLFPNSIYYFQSYTDASDYLGLLAYAISTAILFVFLGRARFDNGDIF